MAVRGPFRWCCRRANSSISDTAGSGFVSAPSSLSSRFVKSSIVSVRPLLRPYVRTYLQSDVDRIGCPFCLCLLRATRSFWRVLCTVCDVLWAGALRLPGVSRLGSGGPSSVELVLCRRLRAQSCGKSSSETTRSDNRAELQVRVWPYVRTSVRPNIRRCVRGANQPSIRRPHDPLNRPSQRRSGVRNAAVVMGLTGRACGMHNLGCYKRTVITVKPRRECLPMERIDLVSIRSVNERLISGRYDAPTIEPIVWVQNNPWCRNYVVARLVSELRLSVHCLVSLWSWGVDHRKADHYIQSDPIPNGGTSKQLLLRPMEPVCVPRTDRLPSRLSPLPSLRR